MLPASIASPILWTVDSQILDGPMPMLNSSAPRLTLGRSTLDVGTLDTCGK
jgi:hypothetical protein